jgi:hypothetical protein
MTRPPIDPRWPQNPNAPGVVQTFGSLERRLRICARCGADAEGEKGRPMFGVLVDDLGSVPALTIIREVARTRLLVRLRLCNACHDEAKSYALDFSGSDADGLASAGDPTQSASGKSSRSPQRQEP